MRNKKIWMGRLFVVLMLALLGCCILMQSLCIYEPHWLHVTCTNGSNISVGLLRVCEYENSHNCTYYPGSFASKPGWYASTLINLCLSLACNGCMILLLLLYGCAPELVDFQTGMAFSFGCLTSVAFEMVGLFSSASFKTELPTIILADWCTGVRAVDTTHGNYYLSIGVILSCLGASASALTLAYVQRASQYKGRASRPIFHDFDEPADYGSSAEEAIHDLQTKCGLAAPRSDWKGEHSLGEMDDGQIPEAHTNKDAVAVIFPTSVRQRSDLSPPLSSPRCTDCVGLDLDICVHTNAGFLPEVSDDLRPILQDLPLEPRGRGQRVVPPIQGQGRYARGNILDSRESSRLSTTLM